MKQSHKAGLLTSLFGGLPIPSARDSGESCQNKTGYTAAGTVEEFPGSPDHLIPYYSAFAEPFDAPNVKEDF